MKTGDQLREDAERWIAKNPDAWIAFTEKARFKSNHRKSWSARGIAESLRWDERYSKAEGARFKIPNAITPVLGRIVVEKYPETKPFFLHSRSKVDAL